MCFFIFQCRLSHTFTSPQDSGVPLSEARGNRRQDFVSGRLLLCKQSARAVSWQLRAALTCPHQTRVHWDPWRPSEPHDRHRPCSQRLPLEQWSLHDEVEELSFLSDLVHHVGSVSTTYIMWVCLHNKHTPSSDQVNSTSSPVRRTIPVWYNPGERNHYGD